MLGTHLADIMRTGSATDTLARLLVAEVASILGQTIVIDGGATIS